MEANRVRGIAHALERLVQYSTMSVVDFAAETARGMVIPFGPTGATRSLFAHGRRSPHSLPAAVAATRSPRRHSVRPLHNAWKPWPAKRSESNNVAISCERAALPLRGT